jgi:UDP-glucose 4-epimerase
VKIFPGRCENVIYLAQSPHWRTFPEGAADVFEINVHAALRAAEYARGAGTRRFLFASTGSVYSQTESAAHEDDPLQLNAPRNFYVASKLAAELLLQPYAELFHMITLRLFVPYGSGQHPTMLFPTLVQRIRSGRPIELHGGDGMRLNPVAAADVAEALARCLDLDQTATLNVAGPEVLTLREVGMQIGQDMGIAPAFELRPGPAPVIVGDMQAMKACLGWAPGTVFADGLQTWEQEEPGLFERQQAGETNPPPG